MDFLIEKRSCSLLVEVWKIWKFLFIMVVGVGGVGVVEGPPGVSIGKFVFQKLSCVRFQPQSEGNVFVTGSWEDHKDNCIRLWTRTSGQQEPKEIQKVLHQGDVNHIKVIHSSISLIHYIHYLNFVWCHFFSVFILWQSLQWLLWRFCEALSSLSRPIRTKNKLGKATQGKIGVSTREINRYVLRPQRVG